MSAISKSRRTIANATARSLRIPRRCLSTTPARQGSPLFALGALSNSRETQHFAKESRLSRVEHSPNLQLIQSSEVAPFARVKPPTIQEPALDSGETLQTRPTDLPDPTPNEAPVNALGESELMSLGRAILAEKDAEITKLQQQLEEVSDRSSKREATYDLAKTRSREQILQLRKAYRSERLWKWVAIIVSAVLATWITSSTRTRGRFSFGEAYFARDARKARQMPEGERPANTSSLIAPPPVEQQSTVIVAPSPARREVNPSEQHSSWFNRLFWRS